MISPFSLLACSVMSSWPWRCRLIRGDLPCVCLLVLASTSASRLSFRLSRSSRLPAPLARVGERGAWASGVLLPFVSVPCRRGMALLASWVMGDECVDFVDVLPIG